MYALLQAVVEKQKAEDISAVLYPNDSTDYGKELRLKQQVFFVSASIQDVLARYKVGTPAFCKICAYTSYTQCEPAPDSVQERHQAA